MLFLTETVLEGLAYKLSLSSDRKSNNTRNDTLVFDRNAFEPSWIVRQWTQGSFWVSHTKGRLVLPLVTTIRDVMQSEKDGRIFDVPPLLDLMIWIGTERYYAQWLHVDSTDVQNAQAFLCSCNKITSLKRYAIPWTWVS